MLRVTSDDSLATIEAVQFRIESLVGQGLENSVRVKHLRARIGINNELLPLPVEYTKAAKLNDDGTIVLPNGEVKKVADFSNEMIGFKELVKRGLVKLKATIYKHYNNGTGEYDFNTIVPQNATVSVCLNETPKTSSSQIRGAFTGEVIIESLTDFASKEIEPFLTARASKKRHEGAKVKIYNNPLFLIAADMLAAA